ncbi:heterokaryon incompatibility protein-domain-containing protein, partial [Hyaloscypha sp. PMI_1271]
MKTDAAKCWATIGTADPVCENNYDSRAVCRIKKWLNQCKESHQLCRGGEGMFMPRRALDLGLEGIGDPGDPVLVDTDKQYPYVALSYCWGSAKEKWVLTKKINIGQHRQSLPFSQLPATLRDAINLTKKLGFRFIWIDALCIIQDDYMDWVTEAATMGDVYYNASLVLAANTSGDCTLVGPGNAHFSLIPPLDSRGWTFQETILARRVVRLSLTEMAWHCAELERCECSFSDLGFDKAEIKSTTSADDLYQVWKMLVQNYSTRYLTLREDKLIAISGVAR